jgi:NADH-quinone oxidoreductase subunit F
VKRIVDDVGRGPDAVVAILQAIQRHYRYLPEEALQRVCELTEITPAAITGVSTFYDSFRHRPVGRHTISICTGTACHVKGAELIQDAVATCLNLAPGADTTDDNNFTVLPTACFGCCTLAPVMRIDGHNCGHLTAQQVSAVIRQSLRTRRQTVDPILSAVGPGDGGEIRVGLGSCCMAQGSGLVHDEISRVLASTRVPAVVKGVGCIGMCHQTPLVEIVTPGGQSTFYSKAQPGQMRDIVLRHFQPRGIVRRLGYQLAEWVNRLHSDAGDETVHRHALNVREGPVCAFLGPQRHIATEQCGHLNPLDLDEYRRADGFAALRRCLTELTPDQISDEVRRAGLRGRGGAGFPTAVKWDLVRRAESSTKYVICNGDEGDPGAFMDRMILESFPYRVIEGMIIAARAVGATEGLFYIRAEYPEAVKRVTEAIRRCLAQGLLGDAILGSDFRLHLAVKQGAGAFICGEETALIHSIEGQRGTPRLRPPYPAEQGLWGQPTLINNVETFALVPWIFRHGAAAFAAMGTERSKGTKVFALAGRVLRGGLIEVPMGVTLRQIVQQIGGGVAPGRRWKAVQIGGPSGGCVPAELADLPVDYEALAQVGAIMGSGGMVVLDDTDCMVDIARYFLRFTQDQSCGKCTYCRIGTKRMLDILDRICTGQGRAGDLQQLEQLSTAVGAGSLCGLGKTAPNPVLSTLKYFRHEYEAHLKGRCPAGKCKALIHYQVTNHCIGCTLCAQHCPVNAIPFTPYQIHQIDDPTCTRCDTCRDVCPQAAIVITSGGVRTAESCPA